MGWGAWPCEAAAAAGTGPMAEGGGGSGGGGRGASSGACMWGFIGSASFMAVRGVWGLLVSDEDARAQRDMERRLQIKSLEDEITFVSGVTRRCWSACIEDADAPTQGNIAVDLSADELSCIGNCTSKVKAFQMRAAEVLMDQDAKKREANMKQMMHQQRAA